MSWEKDQIGKHCEITSSKRIFYSEYESSGVPFYRSKEIIEKNQGQEISESLFISLDRYNDIKKQFGVPLCGDMLLTSVGTIGVPYIVKKDDYFYFKDGNLTWFRNFDEKLSSKFLYYWISSKESLGILNNATIGSSQKALTIATLKKIEIPIPPLEIQEKIAGILSAYDDLIENNRKQIKLLEEAAQRLYKEWFVNFNFPGRENVKFINGLPEGWRKKSMEEIASYLNGFAFKPSDWDKIGKPIIKIKELNEGITKNTPRNSGKNIPEKYNISAGDLIFSWSATLTAKIWDAEDGILNQHLFKVTPQKGISREYLLQSILYKLGEFQNLTTGATMKHIQREKLTQVFVNVPADYVMKKYEVVATPLRKKILSLNQIIIKLSEARDRLLPKLMSGEISDFQRS